MTSAPSHHGSAGLSGMVAVMKRELRSYIQTPVAYVFLVVFLVAAGSFTFYLGNYFNRGIADLEPFFRWHPWLYLMLVPAVTMRLWAEEHKSGTVELIMTLPISLWQIIAGKFLAAWIFVALGLCATFPMWLTVSYLGNPDHGVIFVSYLGSLLMAGAYIAIGSTMSSLTSNQVIAFVLSGALNLVFVMAGFSVIISFVEGWMPQIIVELIMSMSFLTHFQEITQGVLYAHSVVYFLTMIWFWLFVTLIMLQQRR